MIAVGAGMSQEADAATASREAVTAAVDDVALTAGRSAYRSIGAPSCGRLDPHAQ